MFLILMTGIYSALRAGMLGYRNIGETLEVYQDSRRILGALNSDLRNSFVYSEEEAKFSGDSNGMSFLTLVDSYKDGSLKQEFALVSYKYENGGLTRLAGINQAGLKAAPQDQPDEMSTNIEKFSLSYGWADVSGAVQFKEAWPGQDAPEEKKLLPAAVKVSFSIKGKTSRDFQRVIYLSPAGQK